MTERCLPVTENRHAMTNIFYAVTERCHAVTERFLAGKLGQQDD